MLGDNTIFELAARSGRVQVEAGALIGTGRVASVFELVAPEAARSLVLKLYRDGVVPDEVETLIRLIDERKLDELVPIGVEDESAFPLVAAPKALAFAPGSDVPIGIAILKVDPETFSPLGKLLTSTLVKNDLRFTSLVALRLANLVEEIHRAGFIIGDISGNNLMVSHDAHCTIIDVDSFGAMSQEGQRTVTPGFATANFLAPELQNGGAPDQRSDEFVIGCIVLQLLLRGMHPFGGVKRGSSGSTVQENINARASFLLQPARFTLPQPYQAHLSMGSLHPSSRILTQRLVEGDYPSPSQWVADLALLATAIEHCDTCGAQRFENSVCWRCGDWASRFNGTHSAPPPEATQATLQGQLPRKRRFRFLSSGFVSFLAFLGVGSFGDTAGADSQVTVKPDLTVVVEWKPVQSASGYEVIIKSNVGIVKNACKGQKKFNGLEQCVISDPVPGRTYDVLVTGYKGTGSSKSYIWKQWATFTGPSFSTPNSPSSVLWLVVVAEGLVIVRFLIRRPKRSRRQARASSSLAPPIMPPNPPSQAVPTPTAAPVSAVTVFDPDGYALWSDGVVRWLTLKPGERRVPGDAIANEGE